MSLTSDTTWYGVALELAKKEYTQANLATYKRDGLYQMAYCYQRLGDHEQALKWFSNISCKDKHAYVEIARSLMALGRYDEAMHTLAHVTERYPEETKPLVDECNRAMGR